jgi:hypothetical protein
VQNLKFRGQKVLTFTFRIEPKEEAIKAGKKGGKKGRGL